MARPPLVALLRSCHPGPVVAVTTMSALYARSRRQDVFKILSVAGAVLAGQLAIGWQNDALDVGRDRTSERGDKPAALGQIQPEDLTVAAALAGGACAVLSLLSGPSAALTHLVAVGSAAMYNMGLKATPLSIGPYALSFGLLPAFVTLAEPTRRWPPWWTMGSAALLGAGAHVANTLPDLSADRANGVVGLPHRLGPDRSLVVMGVCLLAATALLAMFGPGPLWRRASAGAASVALIGAAVRSASLNEGSRRPFNLVLGVAIMDVALLLTEAGMTR